MFDRPGIESLAVEIFEHEWTRVADADALSVVLNPSPRWLLPELVRLLDQCDGPVRELEPTVRELILEHDFVEEPGDAVIDAGHHRRREQYVRALLRTLARLRQWALERGEWSGLPATPQMYG